MPDCVHDYLFLAPKNLHNNSLEGFGANKETAYRK